MNKEPLNLVLLHAEASRSTFAKIFRDLLEVSLGDCLTSTLICASDQSYDEVAKQITESQPDLILSELWWQHVPLQELGLELARDPRFAQIPMVILSYNSEELSKQRTDFKASPPAGISAERVFGDKNQMGKLIGLVRDMVTSADSQTDHLQLVTPPKAG